MAAGLLQTRSTSQTTHQQNDRFDESFHNRCRERWHQLGIDRVAVVLFDHDFTPDSPAANSAAQQQLGTNTRQIEETTAAISESFLNTCQLGIDAVVPDPSFAVTHGRPVDAPPRLQPEATLPAIMMSLGTTAKLQMPTSAATQPVAAGSPPPLHSDTVTLFGPEFTPDSLAAAAEQQVESNTRAAAGIEEIEETPAAADNAALADDGSAAADWTDVTSVVLTIVPSPPTGYSPPAGPSPTGIFHTHEQTRTNEDHGLEASCGGGFLSLPLLNLPAELVMEQKMLSAMLQLGAVQYHAAQTPLPLLPPSFPQPELPCHDASLGGGLASLPVVSSVPSVTHVVLESETIGTPDSPFIAPDSPPAASAATLRALSPRFVSCSKVLAGPGSGPGSADDHRRTPLFDPHIIAPL